MKYNTALTPKNFSKLVQPTGNVYESAVVIAKRAKQVVIKTKEELQEKVATFTSPVDNAEEVVENKEHIEFSKHYERQPKPTVIATEEYLANKIMYRYPDEETSPVI
mmetsp:Transcript_6348/g.14365  ORF Transcript_6348/g.14365 Transcript_6348/m.14365 type:complete len:107 (+) Transcript_6348:339-659(+)|eukprot:CAMPEP_0116848902 /NCGR_PEP_ID=MMETSP0418-20121206/15269_1 /TAXON_ID=1158023 /ORGANISM="Astrosyne radiata, Strain 13vi08-1A" /LENGTH=106 /DNA_ID=CAMNT_0004480553 /DNA_START=501 /DNA_END=821 /DNA_ORIENTATION=-